LWRVIPQAGVSGGLSIGGRAALVSGVANDASTERKLDFLLDQAKRNQDRLNELERQIVDVPVEIRRELNDMQVESQRKLEATLDLRERRYDRQRFWGIMLVAFGGVLGAAANLVA
jgi:hypothetical protein